MSTIIDKYTAAIVAGNIEQIKAVFSETIKVMPPGSNQSNEGKSKAAMMLSCVAAVVTNFKVVRTYNSNDDWHTILLEGTINDVTIQFIDQVHVDQNQLVDQVDIFLRPALMAAGLLEKVTAEIKRRTSV